MDATSVLTFAGINDVEGYLVSDDDRAIEADKALFIDTEQSGFWTGLAYRDTNRLLPELATRR